MPDNSNDFVRSTFVLALDLGTVEQSSPPGNNLRANSFNWFDLFKKD